MFNSLPNYLKEKVRSEYHLRLFVVVLSFIILLQISFLIFLFPSWLISLYKENEVISQVKKSDKLSLDSEIEVINSTVESINTKLTTINSTLEYPKVIRLMDGILSKKTKDIYIKELAYTSLGETKARINLVGTGATRESLVFFVKKLEESRFFEKVDLPISNFTRDRNINFSINLTVSL